MKNPIKMDGLGVPIFQETSTFVFMESRLMRWDLSSRDSSCWRQRRGHGDQRGSGTKTDGFGPLALGVGFFGQGFTSSTTTTTEEFKKNQSITT